MGFLSSGREHLFVVSRVDFPGFQEKRNIRFGNKRITNINNYYLYMLAILRFR